MNKLSYATAMLALLAVVAGPGVADAARSYDNCTGFVDTVPAVISSQGTWCLRKDLATNLASGNAILVTASNVILDCNDFKLGNLAAGESSVARGIQGNRGGLTVRNCNVRGYFYGVFIAGDAAVVEDNRLDGSLARGIRVVGDGGIVRRNRIADTVSPATGGDAIAIDVYGDTSVVDNEILGVLGVANTAYPIARGNGIRVVEQTFGLIARNVIGPTDVVKDPGWTNPHYSRIYVESSNHTRIIDNIAPGGGIECTSAAPHARGNSVLMVFGCANDGNFQ